MKKTVSPETWRLVLLVGNFLLLAVMVQAGYYAFGLENFLGSEQQKIKVKLVKPTELETYRIPEDQGPLFDARRSAHIANLFEPPPPPVEITEGNDEPEKEEVAEVEEEGPLSEKWELESVLETPINKVCIAQLAEKQEDPASSRRPTTSRYRSTRSRTSSTRSVRPTTTRRPGNREFASIRLYDAELNPYPERIGDNWYFFVRRELLPKKKIYYREAETINTKFEEAGKKIYVLAKEEEPEGNPLEIRPVEEEKLIAEARRRSGSKEEHRSMIKVGNRTIPAEADEDDNASSSKGSGSSTVKTSSIRSRSTVSRQPTTGRTPKQPSAEDIKRLNEIRSKIPADARKKLDDALNKAQ